jgi:HD superfamily phosphohydrolase
MNADFLRDEARFSVAVRDPVWKHIWLTPEFRDIMQTPSFLRLYRIKQLGPTEYVYPGATHSRAAHSIGVYHVAKRILGVLANRGADEWITEQGCKSFLAAALLHDLGHFPFTHSLKELPLVDHETLTARLILEEPLKTAVAEAGADPEMTAAIVDKADEVVSPSKVDGETRFFRNLLSGVLDPDKLDYLNRDAYCCGVPYGIQDTDFILSRIMPDRERGIVIDSRAIMSIESILFSKYLMYRSVYWHKSVRMATAMMKKALSAALAKKLIDPETLYGLDDEGIYALVDSIDYPERVLARSIRSRAFYETVVEFPFRDSDADMRKLENLEARADAEIAIAETLSTSLGVRIQPYQVLIDIPERISFESSLFVVDEKRAFSDSSTVFSGDTVRKFTESLRMVRIAIEPAIAEKIRGNPGAEAKLAKYFGVSYTLTGNANFPGEPDERT